MMASLTSLSVAAKCAVLVRTKDTGTLQYELYFNSDNTECLAFERYRVPRRNDGGDDLQSAV
jgi:hypothetical protein